MTYDRHRSPIARASPARRRRAQPPHDPARPPTRLATVEGLDRLSIGELAAHIGMSKSGLYAHFRSKEELQLATIDAAEAIFDEVVVGPMHDAEPGLPAVLALSDCVPRPPAAADLPGRLLLRVRLGGAPVATGAGQGADRGVRRSLEGALRRAPSRSPQAAGDLRRGRGPRPALLRARRVPAVRARGVRVPRRSCGPGPGGRRRPDAAAIGRTLAVSVLTRS